MKAKRVGATALLLALVLSLAGCGKSVEKQLVGSWYLEGKNKPNFTPVSYTHLTLPTN